MGVALLVAACGRIDFDPAPVQPPADGGAADAGAVDATTSDAAGLDGAPSADGGGEGGAGDAGTDAGPPRYNVMFTTSRVIASDFGGALAADAICQSDAAAAGLAGTFVAWVSDSTSAVADRMGIASGWVRTDGKVVAATRADLFASRLVHPPILDEHGGALTSSRAWTGTREDGAPSTSNCVDWTAASSGEYGECGASDSVIFNWTARAFCSCAQTNRFYCLQIDHTSAPPLPAPVSGRRIYAAPWSGVGQSPDDACETERARAGLAGSYLALIAFDAAAPLARFTLDRWPWVLVDGSVVARDMEQLASNVLERPVRTNASGDTYDGVVVTGSTRPDLPGSGYTCANWTTTTGEMRTGLSYHVGSAWFSNGRPSCAFADYAVYCLEE